MKLINQNIEGCALIQNNVFDDERGLFFEAMNQKILSDLNVPRIEQVNISKSKYGVFRGFIIRSKMNLLSLLPALKEQS